MRESGNDRCAAGKSQGGGRKRQRDEREEVSLAQRGNEQEMSGQAKGGGL